ncbi:MAG: hypothetical protein G3M78_14820 [Candidatus Nitrohelix vancouverensis]|uniref:Lipoprotein n=1 Tax=Candidatus Nitrohelix vancouverensis TaxID=2705534 RepID=A0A7T0G4L0_9BACT|nr:MAG: hypothetical protein G3M78_14820 [Candidatus Nitrohelix vancouverensis]
MNPRKPFYFPKSRLTCSALLFLLATLFNAGCATDIFETKLRDLNDVIQLYNIKIEGRVGEQAVFLLDPDYREAYIERIHEFNERVRFMDSHLVSLEFLKDGAKVGEKNRSDDEAEGEFNEAIATFSYQLTISPSSTLETRLHKQKWVYKMDKWMVQPDLDEFLK